MRLEQLSAGLSGRIAGDGAAEIDDISFDSRAVEAGTLFVCVRGMVSDGHDFAAAAAAAGAAALVVEEPLDVALPQLVVPDSRRAMAPLAARLFGEPSAALRIVGITGTNGKTTTAFLVRAILAGAGVRCGLLGTIKRIVAGREEEVERTTPEAIDLQRTFRRMVDGGDAACAMEVSSHALALGRAAAIDFDVAVFTNLTQDHLDFHADMDEYFEAKRLLFRPGAPGEAGAAGAAGGEDGGAGGGNDAPTGPGAAVVNVDDPFGRRLASELADGPGVLTRVSSAGRDADLTAHDVSFDASGSRFELRGAGEPRAVRLRLPGHFNVDNALAALAAALALGVDLDDAIPALAAAEPVPGRMEPVEAGQPFGVLVDYAHTPDSLENVLGAARLLAAGRLLCVFGCGGDRDPLKRPLMGRAAATLSDLAIVTSDNPRSEDPDAIIADVLDGIAAELRERIVVEPDRRKAIARAIGEARAGDLVVIAGKGHEQGQELAAGRRIPFDDRQVAREELARRAAGAGGRS